MFFFFNDTATTEIYTLSLHDALPIYGRDVGKPSGGTSRKEQPDGRSRSESRNLNVSNHKARNEIRLADRKSTRLNSSHANISYAAFCLKKYHSIKNIPPSIFFIISDV